MAHFRYPLAFLIIVIGLCYGRLDRSRLPTTSSAEPSGPSLLVSEPAKASQPVTVTSQHAHPRRPRPPESDISNNSNRLIDNWNFDGTDLVPEAIAPFFSESQPESVVIFGKDGMKRLYPAQSAHNAAQTDQVLFIGTVASVREIARERQEQAEARGGAMPDPGKSDGLVPLPTNAFQIVAYHPGTQDNGNVLKPAVSDLLAALQGPDYSFEDYDTSDAAQVRQHLSSVLRFGHNGEIVLGVSDAGVLVDGPGIDFRVYTTSFWNRRDGTYLQKFGYIGVSETNARSSVRWLPCDPKAGVLRGCVGAVPTEEGGDQFDLGELGVRQARYIWIKDTGINKGYPSDLPAGGLVLDALRLDHAFSSRAPAEI
jgi:hypothetical protein